MKIIMMFCDSTFRCVLVILRWIQNRPVIGLPTQVIVPIEESIDAYSMV